MNYKIGRNKSEKIEEHRVYVDKLASHSTLIESTKFLSKEIESISVQMPPPKFQQLSFNSTMKYQMLDENQSGRYGLLFNKFGNRVTHIFAP